jgi:hypothetical protein
MQPIELPAVSEDDMSRKPTNESTDPLTGRLGAARGRTAKAAGISRSAVKSRCACERGAWDQLSEDGPGQHNPDRSGAAKLVGVLAGESPARGTCPVAPVVISGGGAGDQSAGSPEVKVLVGWVKTWSAPTGGQANRQVVTQANGSEAPKLRVLTRIGV